ncbi:MAG: hypothetical protein K6B65_01200 [Bacilli bacterium]|nr:hypothetical protein [Bacilli bacterium]
MEIIKSEKGFLTILTGKSGMGKSTITVYDASEFLKSGQSVIFFSYEYCQSIIVNKLVNHFGMSWSTLLRLNIVDASGLNIHTLSDMLRIKADSADAVYIDYLDLLREATYAKADSVAEEKKQIKNIVAELSELAKELNIPIILLSQVGSHSKFEDTIDELAEFTEKVKHNNVIKMFIGKANIIDSRINYDDIVHLILIDGYDLRHFSSINIKEIYKDS